MANSVPLSLYPFSMPALDLDGNPLAGGLIQFYLAGTTTPEPIYADVNGDAELSNPVVLDTSGFATIFMGPTLYDTDTYTSLSVLLYTIEGVGDPGQIVFAGLGNIQTQGSKNVATGYTILSTDNFVTTATGATAVTLQLPSAASRSTANNGNGLPLIVQNYTSNTCTIEPDGADTINNDTAGIVLAAAANPVYHHATFYSDGASAWYAITG